MARGFERIKAQEKARKKQALKNKHPAHECKDQRQAAKRVLPYTCVICKVQMPDVKTYKYHFESKHSKNKLPDELKDVQ